MPGPRAGLQVSIGVHKCSWFPSPARSPNLCLPLSACLKSFQRHKVLPEGRIPIFLRVRNPFQTKLGVLYGECRPQGGAGLLTAKHQPHRSPRCRFSLVQAPCVSPRPRVAFAPQLCVCARSFPPPHGTAVPAQPRWRRHGPYERWGAGAPWLMQDHGPHVKDKHNPFYTTVKSWPTLTLYTCSMQ